MLMLPPRLPTHPVVQVPSQLPCHLWQLFWALFWSSWHLAQWMCPPGLS